MDDLFDDPGDLGFFDQKEEALEPDEVRDDLFYEPFPGEDDNG